MNIFDYGMDPMSGATYVVDQDIIVTPFWTPEYCAEVVKVCKQLHDRFQYDPSVDYATDDLQLTHISSLLMADYREHFRHRIVPLLDKVYLTIRVEGLFSPFIVRYAPDKKRTLDLHWDLSMVSMSVKLNDDYEGSKIIFPRQGLDNSTVPVGHAMIWPSLVTHPHYVTDITQGEKYSLTCWSWPPKFEADGLPL